jgi:hypothetical protein
MGRFLVAVDRVGDALYILNYFIEKTALKAPVVGIFDTSMLTTLQVAPPLGVVDAFGVHIRSGSE